MSRNFFSKKFLFLTVVLFGIILSLPAFSSPLTGSNNQISYQENQIIVKFEEGINPQDVLKEVDLGSQDFQRIYPTQTLVSNFKKDYKLERDSQG